MDLMELLLIFVLGISFAMLLQYIIYIQIRDINNQFNDLAKDYADKIKLLIKVQKERDYYKRKVDAYESKNDEEL